jgi:hypothetical protein
MKLTSLALIVAFATGMAVPAYAAMDKAQMDTMKAELDKAGKTDESRMAFWKGMAPDRQAFWKEQCNTGEVASLPQKEIESRGDIPSFCKAINKP